MAGVHYELVLEQGGAHALKCQDSYRGNGIVSYREALIDHLAWWGLRRFESDAAYFQWQRETLNAGDITHLNHLIEQKRLPEAGAAADVEFYDFAARPHILPVLYSQRYAYYITVGSLIAERVQGVRAVLDFGCGPGILTTFYARQFPDIQFVGLDRSRDSLEAAQGGVAALGLTNVRFEAIDVEHASFAGSYDLIVSTHALLQSETDPGIPSATWQTFDRPNDARLQKDFEQETGLSARLDALCRVLTSQGRLIVFEKTRPLARRVPFQRALAVREFHLLEPPIPIRYSLVEEIADDGPFYVLGRRPTLSLSGGGVPWDETPESGNGDELYWCEGDAARFVLERLPGRVAAQAESRPVPRGGYMQVEKGQAAGSLAYLYVMSGDGRVALFIGGPAAIETADQKTEAVRAVLDSAGSAPPSQADLACLPLYENHTASAQSVWSRFTDREILKTTTLEEAGGRQMHVELGRASTFIYVYWANTFDQRQVVIVEPARAQVLEQYYQEFLDGR